VISAESVRMSALIDSLLFLARVDARTETVQLEPLDIRRLCLQTLDKWRPLLQYAKIDLTSDLPSRPVAVLADSLYLQRLLNIVVENAAKYTGAGGSIRLTLEESKDSVRIEVSDTGIGIPVQDRDRIFQRFYRGSNVQQLSEAHGSGLGLALAAWIAERHKTTIKVDSTEGRGSSFSWTLPVSAFGPQDVAEEKPPMAENRVLKTTSSSGGVR
jgi:signal transduction histidine kinase